MRALLLSPFLDAPRNLASSFEHYRASQAEGTALVHFSIYLLLLRALVVAAERVRYFVAKLTRELFAPGRVFLEDRNAFLVDAFEPHFLRNFWACPLGFAHDSHEAFVIFFLMASLRQVLDRALVAERAPVGILLALYLRAVGACLCRSRLHAAAAVGRACIRVLAYVAPAVAAERRLEPVAAVNAAPSRRQA